ncbi:hypothetical protein LTR24_008275 [Lithohypha guttulata]|uniref:Clr5 domain-containing protein n=1 Tax=Lithohypha guttulata TaxID=1690604 RepID=A0ABR0K2B9_9EURO|nr:hypothetical protein LTR24_008275 [Lithohypha guttulata]
MQWMKEQHNFAPSKRAFQTQFKRWDFPSKQNPAHRNVDLVTRVKELWEQNYSQRDMVKTLNDEGFQIKERELMRVRAKNRWLLRIPNGQKASPEDVQLEAQLLAAAAEETGQEAPPQSPAPAPASAPVEEALPDDVLRKRKERHDKMQAESDERWANKKRRRRTRDYAGIPADPPGPPRFPSETTLGESMDFLEMNPDLYKEARADFQRICEDMRIIKKTLAGTDRWQAAKDRLVQENAHLNAVFANPDKRQAKDLSLDVIATDVTKRMRTMDTRMTIVDAKNILGVNPEQSRQIRNSFYLILQNDHFTSKLETGPEHWNELKDQWILSTPMLQDIMREDQDPALLERKKKALEVLCRDVMKRLRDAQKRDDGTAKPPAPKPAPARKEKPAMAPPLPTLDTSDLQIDPSILADTASAATAQAQPPPELPAPAPSPTSPIPVYLKPHPQSTIHAKDKMFLSQLSTRTYAELTSIILSKWSDSAIVKIEGMAKAPTGSEIPFTIDGDDELDAYLDHVQGAKVVFVVQVNQA